MLTDTENNQTSTMTCAETICIVRKNLKAQGFHIERLGTNILKNAGEVQLIAKLFGLSPERVAIEIKNEGAP